jgi:hypothetical protein
VTRRTLSFLFASVLLFAGIALSVFEIIRGEGVRPLVPELARLVVGRGRGLGSEL